MYNSRGEWPTVYATSSQIISEMLPEIHSIEKCVFPKSLSNQLLQPCTARTAWSYSVIRSETSLITESDRRGPIR